MPTDFSGLVLRDAKKSGMPQFTKQQLAAQALRAKEGPTPEQIASEAMGDIEWQADVANFLGPMGYAMELDPSASKMHAVPGGHGFGKGGSMTMGLHNPGEETYHDTLPDGQGGRKPFSIDPDNIAILGQAGANTGTYGHEYTHRDAELGWSEDQVRAWEAYNEKTKEGWDKRVSDYAALEDISKNSAEHRLMAGITRYGRNRDNIPDMEYDQGARMAPDQLSFMHKLLAPKFREDKDNYSQQRNKQSYIARELRK